MNRNVEQHFAELPGVDIERSIFDRSSEHITSFNVGELIPFYIDEVLPGDTFNVTTSVVVRLQTLLNPIMSNVYLDTYYFFVANRTLYTSWKYFMGESDQAWLPSTTPLMPCIAFPQNGFDVGTIADYLGVPVGVPYNAHPDQQISALPFRAYASVANEWFRDQNLSDPLVIPTNDTLVIGSNGSNYITDVAKGGKPFKVAKYHDYFTSCLPSPQKGLNVGLWANAITSTTFKSFVPVVATDTDTSIGTGSKYPSNPLHMKALNSVGSIADIGVGTSPISGNTFNVQWTSASQTTLSPTNLFADVGSMNLSINELRLAFQLQKFYERCARGGTRYRELILSHFGVHSPDARMMIPEYLGGHRFPLNIHQVANTSQDTANSSFLGDLGAMSNTADIHEDFVKSFTEHGFVIGRFSCRFKIAEKNWKAA